MSVCVNVNPANPGQFLACCGLLELADRFWGAEGCFKDREFRISCGGTLDELLGRLVTARPEEVLELENGLPVKKLIAPLRLTFDGRPPWQLKLDTWIRMGLVKGKAAVLANRPWNFWSGNQTSFEIWRRLRDALAGQIQQIQRAQAQSIFNQRVPLTGRFGFDPGAAWNALDVGFSPNTQQMPVDSSPATEMLAVVGIQRFRPLVMEGGQAFFYATWGKHLPPCVAGAASSGLVHVPPCVRFRGRIVDRGQYSALGYSTLLKGASDGGSSYKM